MSIARRNARQDITAKIVRRNVAATTTHRATHKVVFACATKAGLVRIARNLVLKATTALAAKSNVQLSSMAIRPAITSLVNMSAVPAILD